MIRLDVDPLLLLYTWCAYCLMSIDVLIINIKIYLNFNKISMFFIRLHLTVEFLVG